MEGGGVYDDSVMIKNERLPCTSEVLDSLWASTSPSFHGSASMVSFEDARGDNNSDKQFFPQIDPKSENCDEDDYDGCFRRPEKKRRLSPDQVHFLEKSFEVENKLEPERKVQLAKELGLQPRQVAIWFQNRRARYKTKVLEKEYDLLKANYDKLKSDYDNLCKENEHIKNEVNLLSEKVHNGKVKPELCDPIRALDLQPKNPNLSQDSSANVAASSAKSDVYDSESPHYTEGNHSGSLEAANSSHVFESDFSQDEDDSLSRSLLPAPLCFPKLEMECCDDLQPNSCNLGFPVQDHGTWFWQY